MNYKRCIASITELFIGVILVICSYIDLIDEFWSGMGFAFMLISILQLIRNIRYRINKNYKDDVDIAVTDERNKFIRLKAWSWAGYLFVLIAAVSTIVFKILNQDGYMMFASGCVCLIMLLYWISYYILSRKY